MKPDTSHEAPNLSGDFVAYLRAPSVLKGGDPQRGSITQRGVTDQVSSETDQPPLPEGSNVENRFLAKIDVVRDVLAVVTKFLAKIVGGISKIIDTIFNLIDKSFSVLIDKCSNSVFPISWLFLVLLLFITTLFMGISQKWIELSFSQSSNTNDSTFIMSIIAWLFLLWLFVVFTGKRENIM